ncbi:SDR family NAD(P)-dependent oxidoreductase [Arthrobacter sp. B0490]|uniref:SDR family NAD(P)-dependent oxidoreductase n=1 Tax=Arthrobacter sp. B0490 TaxID=2058891 RepID=UPI000CE3C88F|nr:SDR family NAD(P)-dependent oxidoreductase [Arthrobacter sp. B0490]
MVPNNRSSSDRPAKDNGSAEQRRRPSRRSLFAMAAVGVAAGTVGFGAARITAPGAELPDWTAADMPSLVGRRAIVTGANGYPDEGRSGLGYHQALALATAGANVTIASRNRERGEEAIRRIRAEAPEADLHFETLDLTDLGSINLFVRRVEDSGQNLDLLVNNAGVQGRLQREESQDGSERVFATNARGPFALSAQLRPLLQEADAPRIVWTSSPRVGSIDFDDLQKERTYDYGQAYDDTKLGNLLMAFECERRSKVGGWGITSIAVHPGVCRTNIVVNGPGLDSPEGRRFRFVPPLWQDPAIGALPALYAATSPQASGGAYYGPKQLRGLNGLPGFAIVPDSAQDVELASRYWTVMEDLASVSFS